MEEENSKKGLRKRHSLDESIASYANTFSKWIQSSEVNHRVHACLMDTSRKLDVKPTWILIGVFFFFLIFFGVFDRLITNSVGFFYPAWMSFKAIETSTPEDDKQWLTYWVVYAGFSVLETFSDILLFWMPMYYVIKIFFLLWLFLPNYQGALVVYSKIVRPILIQHEPFIDMVFAKVFGKTHVISESKAVD